MSSELFPCQAFEDRPDDVQICDLTVVRLVLRIGAGIFRKRRYPADLEQIKKDSLIEGCVCEPAW